MNQRKSFTSVIFDLDGTLINSLSDIADAMNQVLFKNGLQTHSYDAYRLFIGRGLRNLVRDAMPGSGQDEKEVERLYGELVLEYKRNLLHKTILYEGIPNVLDILEEKGVSKSVLSNKPDKFTRIIADTLLHKWSFQRIVGSNDSRPRKPDPTTALNICEELHLDPASVLFVGDSSIDMKTAKNAGMTAMGVTWGFRSKKELLESGADFTIDKPMDLLTFLNIL